MSETYLGILWNSLKNTVKRISREFYQENEKRRIVAAKNQRHIKNQHVDGLFEIYRTVNIAESETKDLEDYKTLFMMLKDNHYTSKSSDEFKKEYNKCF